MGERLTGNSGETPGPEWEELFYRLKAINGQLRDFYTERDHSPTGRLSEEHRTREEQVIAQKGSLFFDILAARQAGKIPYPVPVFVEQMPDEILHPFSENGISLQYPVPESSAQMITAKTTLPQIRKPDSSTGVLDLLDDYEIIPEDPKSALERSINEITNVRDAEMRTRKENGPKEFRFALNRLQTHLVIDRLIGARINATVPEGYEIAVGFLSASSLHANPEAHLVEILVNTSAVSRSFMLLPPHAYRHVPELREKLLGAIKAIGGYDYFDYRRDLRPRKLN